jgi:hypothetical protein
MIETGMYHRMTPSRVERIDPARQSAPTHAARADELPLLSVYSEIERRPVLYNCSPIDRHATCEKLGQPGGD